MSYEDLSDRLGLTHFSENLDITRRIGYEVSVHDPSGERGHGVVDEDCEAGWTEHFRMG
jgi:hypothetical protein